jgi:hypothetical protein
MGLPAWLRPPPDPAAKAARDASGAAEARAEADALGMLHGRGVLPRQFRDVPTPAPPQRLGPLAASLLRALQQARAPVTAAELAAALNAPVAGVALALGGLVRSRLAVALPGDARGLRYWPCRGRRGGRR